MVWPINCLEILGDIYGIRNLSDTNSDLRPEAVPVLV